MTTGSNPAWTRCACRPWRPPAWTWGSTTRSRCCRCTTAPRRTRPRCKPARAVTALPWRSGSCSTWRAPCGSTSSSAITATCSAPGCACAGLAFTPTACATSPTVARSPTATTVARFEWLVRSGSGERFYSNLRQDDLGGNLSLRFPLWSQAWGTLGGFAAELDPRVHQPPFSHGQEQQQSGRRRLQTPDRGAAGARADRHAPPTCAKRRATTTATNPTQLLYAGYAMLESPIVGPLSIAGGVRTEVLSQKVESHSPFPRRRGARSNAPNAPTSTILPGAALKYQLSPKLVLRAAYGMTVARPQIRELAPYQYYDFLRDRGVEGNPDLKRTRIHNVDLRGEWFFAEGQIVALSGFYKRFLGSHRADHHRQHRRRRAVQQRNQRAEPGRRGRNPGEPGSPGFARCAPSTSTRTLPWCGRASSCRQSLSRICAQQPAAGGSIALRREPVAEIFQRERKRQRRSDSDLSPRRWSTTW